MHPTDVATVHVSSLLILARHLERRGLDLGAWRQEAGLADWTTIDPDARVPIPTMLSAWRTARALTRSPTLALEVGADHVCMGHSMLGHLNAHADTLGEALRNLCRYFVFISGGMTVTLETTAETARLAARNFYPETELWPSVAQRTLAAVFTTARDETGGAFSLQRVEWDHPAPDAPEAFDKFFKARCHFREPRSQLVFDRAMLDLPLLHRNPALHSFFRQQLETCTAALCTPDSTAEELRRILPGLIDRGELSAAAAARTLHVSLRTLHRALAAEQTTFQQVLDEVRRERCRLLMQTNEHPLEDIAFACGFADASGFHRAFRRWTGEAPRTFRARQQKQPA
jgi:AraC-like DNA-binding protein